MSGCIDLKYTSQSSLQPITTNIDREFITKIRHYLALYSEQKEIVGSVLIQNIKKEDNNLDSCISLTIDDGFELHHLTCLSSLVLDLMNSSTRKYRDPIAYLKGVKTLNVILISSIDVRCLSRMDLSWRCVSYHHKAVSTNYFSLATE